MKKNHSEFLNITILLITLSLFVNLVFSITVEDIVNKSKTDPEFAWDMYLLYISTQESADVESTDKLGQLLYAKRKLKNYEFALKEDIEGLINFLKSNSLDGRTKYYLLSIFNEEKLFEYALNRVKTNPDVLCLFNLVSGNYEKLSEELLSILIESKDVQKYVQALSKVQNKDTIVESLMNRMLKQFTNAESTDERKKYLSIYQKIVSYYPEYKISTFEKFEKSLSSKTFSFIEFIKNLVSLLKNVLQNVFISKQNINVAIILAILIVFLSLLSFRIVRYYFYSLIGNWRWAALVYKKIVEKDPLNDEKRLKLAQLYEKAGMYEEAMNEYNFLKRIKLE